MTSQTHQQLFESHRPHLFGVAYRMLGSVMDAEDILQEAFLRWQKAELATVETPVAFLTTIVTRLSLDQLKSARVQRERYVGPWLPEPLITSEPAAGMDEALALSDALSIAFVTLLEALTPTERAAFLLREVFSYPYADVAAMLNRTPSSCRQLVSRARRRLAPDQAIDRNDGDEETRQQLTAAFFFAASTGDMDGLVNLLTTDATLYSDGGGKVAAARKPIVGAPAVARFFIKLAQRIPAGFDMRTANINGKHGLILYEFGTPTTVITMDLVDGRGNAIYAVRNPDKLRHVPSLPSTAA